MTCFFCKNRAPIYISVGLVKRFSQTQVSYLTNNKILDHLLFLQPYILYQFLLFTMKLIEVYQTIIVQKYIYWRYFGLSTITI